MAGIRQHYIPQFLQRGFASHTIGSEIYTWVHRKGTRSFNANVKKVGVEKEFYTEGEDTQADDLITDAEGRFGELVEILKANPVGAVSDPQIPRFIAHLEVRTRHIRQNFLQSGNRLIEKLLEFMADDHAFSTYLQKECFRDPVRRQFLPLFMMQFKAERSKIVARLRSDFSSALARGAKNGHIQGLKMAIAPEWKVRRYDEFKFHIIEPNDGPLILGDSAILFHVQGQSAYKTFLDKSDEVKQVILPLSPQRALIGATDRDASLPNNICRALARCSLEYFISAENSERNSLLMEEIGEDADIVPKEVIEQMISERLGIIGNP